MRWMALIPIVLLLAACGFRNTEVIEYRQVTVVPPYETITVMDDVPIDVTTTTIEYY